MVLILLPISILFMSGIALSVIACDAFSTILPVLSIPIANPSPVNTPISINTRDGDLVLSRPLALFTTPPTTPVTASMASLPICLIPFINPATKFLPTSTMSPKNSITLPGISPIFSPTTVTASVNLSLMPFLSSSNLSFTVVTISCALLIALVTISVNLLTSAVLASCSLFVMLVLISLNLFLMFVSISCALLIAFCFISLNLSIKYCFASSNLLRMISFACSNLSLTAFLIISVTFSVKSSIFCHTLMNICLIVSQASSQLPLITCMIAVIMPPINSIAIITIVLIYSQTTCTIKDIASQAPCKNGTKNIITNSIFS